MKTTEEMFQFIFSYLPYKQGDEDLNLGDFAKKGKGR
jgi:S-adenosylmethionine:diacylglycerol 3-amino-3-carboxypropyl transferase